jgi:hypothetical protein
MRRQLVHRVSGQQLLVSGAEGQPPRSLFDFGALGFDPSVADALIRGFIALQGHNVIESQRLIWREIRCFAAALSRKVSLRPLPATCISDLKRWLEKSHYGPKATQGCMNSICRLLRWCVRNTKNVVAPSASLLPAQFLQADVKPRETMGEAVVKAILRCCYTDIERTEARLAQSTLLRAGNTDGPDDDPLRKIIWELLDIGHGEIPSRVKILSMRGGSSVLARAAALGGLTHVIRCLYPTVDDIFSYYLAILIQTSANPQALRLLKRSCIEPHAVRTDLERIVWDKLRARSEQSVDFPMGRVWSAPNLVRRVCIMNQNLVSTVRPGEEELAFLARGKRRSKGVLSWQTIHHCLVAFRQRHGLAYFQLRDLRRAGAKLHHTAGQSIRAAKLRLNHASEITTQRYTPASDLQKEHEQTILKFQGVLVRESRIRRRAPEPPVANPKGLESDPAETVFGFGCKDPFAGLAPGSEPGRMCLQFFRCATCPGALIPVDDIRVVARLLSASEALMQARQRSIREGWTMRFDVMYGPVKTIIDQEILPMLSEAVTERAREFVDLNRLPWIE